MYENPNRSKCLDECTISSPYECHKLRPRPCSVEELRVTCKEIDTVILEKDLHDVTIDLCTCETALSQGLSTFGDIAMLVDCPNKDELINDRVPWNRCFIEVITKELKDRAAQKLSSI